MGRRDDYDERYREGFALERQAIRRVRDRNSEILAPLFSEEDPGVMRSIAAVIERAHRKGRKVGLCGQAPSDNPEFARFLAERGIDSISVTPDALPEVVRVLAKE